MVTQALHRAITCIAILIVTSGDSWCLRVRCCLQRHCTARGRWPSP